jgi:hypothetical protein
MYVLLVCASFAIEASICDNNRQPVSARNIGALCFAVHTEAARARDAAAGSGHHHCIFEPYTMHLLSLFCLSRYAPFKRVRQSAIKVQTAAACHAARCAVASCATPRPTSTDDSARLCILRRSIDTGDERAQKGVATAKGYPLLAHRSCRGMRCRLKTCFHYQDSSSRIHKVAVAGLDVDLGDSIVPPVRAVQVACACMVSAIVCSIGVAIA